MPIILIISLTVIITMIVNAFGLYLFFRYSDFLVIHREELSEKEMELKRQASHELSKHTHDQITSLNGLVNKRDLELRAKEQEIIRREILETQLRQEIEESIYAIQRDAKHPDFLPRFDSCEEMWGYVDRYLCIIRDNVRKVK